MARDAFTRIDDIHNDAINKGHNGAMDGNNVEGNGTKSTWRILYENPLNVSMKAVFRTDCNATLCCFPFAVYALCHVLS